MPPLNKFVLHSEPLRADHGHVRPYQLVRLIDVLKFHAHAFVNLMGMLGKVQGICEASPSDGQLGTSRATIIVRLSEVKVLCETVGLKMSALCVDSFGLSNPDRKMTYKQLASKVEELRRRIEDELSLCLLLQVSTENCAAYENADPFGSKVTGNFGSAAYDVEEASKCFALDRSTACVMHLMRVVEIAVDAIALGVGVKVTAVKAIGTWEQLLNMVRDAIQTNNKANAPPWLVARPFFESVLAYLHAVKDAWRNPAMHAEKKYTPDEAERIYGAIKNLMSHLAEHLNELGAFTP